MYKKELKFLKKTTNLSEKELVKELVKEAINTVNIDYTNAIKIYQKMNKVNL